MSLRSFIETVGAADHTIAIVSDEATGPLEGILAETFAFEENPIDVDTDANPDLEAVLETTATDGGESDGTDGGADEKRDENEARPSDTVAVLLENGTPVAASPMDELYDSLLAINSDLFTTGARGLGEIELPDILLNLEETRLRLRGYPLAHKEKLLLILLSRYIEQQAWLAASGTLRSAFQKLSRLDDEVGTRAVYDELADAAVDVHVYGRELAQSRPAGDPLADLDAAVHTGTSSEYRNGWFVVHRPADLTAPDATPAALVCRETAPRIWDGFWTFDPDRVVEIDEYIASTL